MNLKDITYEVSPQQNVLVKRESVSASALSDQLYQVLEYKENTK